MQIKILSLILFLSPCILVFPQGDLRLYDSTKSIYTDYIVNYSDSISISLLTSGKFSKFQIASNLHNSKESKTLQYTPNSSTALGIGFDYKWFGLSVSFSLPKSNASKIKFGNTKQMDFQTNIYLHRFIFDGNLTTYKGYYVENPAEFDTSWNNTLPYPYRKDIRTASLGAGFCYVANADKFSYKAAFTTTERQKKSAGSWIFGCFFSIYDLSADYNIIDYAKNYLLNDSAKIISATIANIGVSVGYAYTLAWRRYYLCFSFVPGLAYQSSYFRIENNASDINKSGLNVRTQARFAFGYSSDFYYWGFAAVSDKYQLQNSTTSQLKYSFGTAKLFFGWRFGYSRLMAGIL